MADCWEAFSLNKNMTELTDHCWQSFRNELNKEVDRNPQLLQKNNNNNTPMDDEDSDNANQEGAVAVRRGMGKRQVGSPDTSGSSALITPPTKRMATAKNNNKNNIHQQASAIDAIASSTTAPTPSKATPETVASSMSTSTYTPPTYDERKGAGKVVVTFNPNDLKATSTNASAKTQPQQPKCGISYDQFDTNVPKPYRHLFTTLEDRAKALDQHLVRLEATLMERYNIGKDDQNNLEQPSSASDDNAIAPLEGVGVPRQEKICNIGRICNSVRTVV